MGGDITLYLDGDHIAADRLQRTEPIGFGFEYTDVGRDAQSPGAPLPAPAADIVASKLTTVRCA